MSNAFWSRSRRRRRRRRRRRSRNRGGCLGGRTYVALALAQPDAGPLLGDGLQFPHDLVVQPVLGDEERQEVLGRGGARLVREAFGALLHPELGEAAVVGVPQLGEELRRRGDLLEAWINK